MRLYFLLFLIGFSVNAKAAVYDGGEYSPSNVSDKLKSLQNYGPDLAPNQDTRERFSVAPIGKPLYVLGEDNKCYWANFSKSDVNTVLIIYYKSPVSNEHCVYQKEFSPKPSGYSVSVRNGGICLPSYADVEGEKYDWVVRLEEFPASFSKCFDGAQSFGDNVDRKHHLHDQPPQKPTVYKLESEVVKATPAILEVVPEVKQAPKVPRVRAPASKEKVAVEEPSKVEIKKEAKYTLQLSSHATSEEAEKEISRLKGSGVEAFQIHGSVGGKTWFRVCTGQFATGKDARAFQAKTNLKNAFVQKLAGANTTTGQDP